MLTVKLSYSIIDAWERGDFERAVGMYLGDELPATPYMELGRTMHELSAKYTMRTKQLLPQLGGHKVREPIVEQKYQKLFPFSDDIQILLRGIIDLEETTDRGQIITDHKFGRTRSGAYLKKMQLDYYKLLRPAIVEGRYRAQDPYKCKALCTDDHHVCYGLGVKFLTRKNSEQALEHLMTYGGEIIDYLQSQRLLRDYDMVEAAKRQAERDAKDMENDLYADEQVVDDEAEND